MVFCAFCACLVPAVAALVTPDGRRWCDRWCVVAEELERRAEEHVA